MKKILLIEDEEPIRRVLLRILIDENKGYQITESQDGKEGFLKLTKEDLDEYDLIFLSWLPLALLDFLCTNKQFCL